MAHKITDLCIGCLICQKNCPTGAISGSLKEMQTVDPEKCIDCGLCGKLCPKSAIVDMDGVKLTKIPKPEWKKPNIDKDLCAGCSLCVENCPASVLEITGPSFHGDINTIASLTNPDGCIDCRICMSVCPIGAIQF